MKWSLSSDIFICFLILGYLSIGSQAGLLDVLAGGGNQQNRQPSLSILNNPLITTNINNNRRPTESKDDKTDKEKIKDLMNRLDVLSGKVKEKEKNGWGNQQVTTAEPLTATAKPVTSTEKPVTKTVKPVTIASATTVKAKVWKKFLRRKIIVPVKPVLSDDEEDDENSDFVYYMD